MAKCRCSWCRNDHKDFHGYQIGDDELTPHKKVSQRKTVRKDKGCPARRGETKRGHVYVWVEFFGKEWGYARNEHGDLIQKRKDVHWFDKICVGCGHKNNRVYDWGYDYPSRQQSRRVRPEPYEVRHVEYGYRWR